MHQQVLRRIDHLVTRQRHAEPERCLQHGGQTRRVVIDGAGHLPNHRANHIGMAKPCQCPGSQRGRHRVGAGKPCAIGGSQQLSPGSPGHVGQGTLRKFQCSADFKVPCPPLCHRRRVGQAFQLCDRVDLGRLERAERQPHAQHGTMRHRPHEGRPTRTVTRHHGRDRAVGPLGHPCNQVHQVIGPINQMRRSRRALGHQHRRPVDRQHTARNLDPIDAAHVAQRPRGGHHCQAHRVGPIHLNLHRHPGRTGLSAAWSGALPDHQFVGADPDACLRHREVVGAHLSNAGSLGSALPGSVMVEPPVQHPGGTGQRHRPAPIKRCSTGPIQGGQQRPTHLHAVAAGQRGGQVERGVGVVLSGPPTRGHQRLSGGDPVSGAALPAITHTQDAPPRTDGPSGRRRPPTRTAPRGTPPAPGR